MNIIVSEFNIEFGYKLWDERNNRLILNQSVRHIGQSWFEEEEVIELIGETNFIKWRDGNKYIFNVKKIELACYDSHYLDTKITLNNWFLKNVKY